MMRAPAPQLYNVVVDSDATSKLLLQRGRLQARTTIIPLNKIRAHVVPPAKLRAAQDIVDGRHRTNRGEPLVTSGPESWGLEREKHLCSAVDVNSLKRRAHLVRAARLRDAH
ncbi:jg571, partial [Pararge aegeria aegeria]